MGDNKWCPGGGGGGDKEYVQICPGGRTLQCLSQLGGGGGGVCSKLLTSMIGVYD